MGGANAGVELSVSNPHGDTIATINVPITGSAEGINGWLDTDEYGNPHSASDKLGPSSRAGVVYRWLGANERATSDSGLVLMGARLYNRATGAFSSTDPIYGGNSTAYVYPRDPVNLNDITGESACDPKQPATCKGGPRSKLGQGERDMGTGYAHGGGPTGVSLFNQLKYAHLGIRAYREHRKVTRGKRGRIQAHHLIEKRFARQMGGTLGPTGDWASIVVTRKEHQKFTNAWRKAIPYRRTHRVSPGQIRSAAREIYRGYPEIWEALGVS